VVDLLEMLRKSNIQKIFEIVYIIAIAVPPWPLSLMARNAVVDGNGWETCLNGLAVNFK